MMNKLRRNWKTGKKEHFLNFYEIFCLASYEGKIFHQVIKKRKYFIIKRE